MILCPECGVQIHTSDVPANAIKNHIAEQHGAARRARTFREGFEYALSLIPVDEEKPNKVESTIIDRLENSYVEPE